MIGSRHLLPIGRQSAWGGVIVTLVSREQAAVPSLGMPLIQTH